MATIARSAIQTPIGCATNSRLALLTGTSTSPTQICTQGGRARNEA